MDSTPHLHTASHSSPNRLPFPAALRHGIALALLSLSGCNRDPEALPAQTAASDFGMTHEAEATSVEASEEAAYEVLSLAILQRASHGEIAGPYTLVEVPTLYPFVLDSRPEDVDPLRESLAGVESIGPELAARLLEINLRPEAQRPHFQGSRFPPEMPIEVMTNQERKDLFTDGTDAGWARLRAQKKWGRSIITASQPVFNKEGTRAVLMMWLQQGPLAGDGMFMVAYRLGGSWVVYEEAGAPISVSQSHSAPRHSDKVAAVREKRVLKWRRRVLSPYRVSKPPSRKRRYPHLY